MLWHRRRGFSYKSSVLNFFIVAPCFLIPPLALLASAWQPNFSFCVQYTGNRRLFLETVATLHGRKSPRMVTATVGPTSPLASASFPSLAPSPASPTSGKSASSQSGGEPIVKRVYAYAHGFLSDESSFKGRHLQQLLAFRNAHLHLLNLNGGIGEGMGGISYSRGLAAIRALYDKEGGQENNVKLTLVGSSLGGYVAARFAELYPEAVEKLVLFCPGFDSQARWPRRLGEAALRAWEMEGHRDFEARQGVVRVPWSFIEDGCRHPPFPSYTAPALIIHGLRDEVVPVETTTVSLLEQGGGQLKERTQVVLVDDDHGLTQPATLAVASGAILDFLQISAPVGDPDENGAGEEGEGQGAISAADHIEVEAKLALPEDRRALEERILAAGGELKCTVIMTDIYWDLDGEAFSLSNVWLRQRSGVWELKVPAVEGERPNTQTIACYREINDVRDIAAWLVNTFPAQLGRLHHLPLAKMLAAAGAHPIASYTTRRSKFVIRTTDDDKEKGSDEGRKSQSHKLYIDIDETSFGFGLVEVEELVAGHGDIPAAKARIQHCAHELLGLAEIDDLIRGKLERYILLHNPAHHQRLVRQGVFKS